MRSGIILFLMLFSFSLQAQNSDTTNIYKTDTFSISWPVGWTLNTSGYGGTRLFLVSPRFNGQRTTLALTVQDEINCDASADSMLKINLEQLPLAIENYQLVSSTTVERNGIRGFELVYTGSQGGNPRKWKQRGFCYRNATYMLTYAAVPAAYDSFDKEAEKIMDALHFAP